MQEAQEDPSIPHQLKLLNTLSSFVDMFLSLVDLKSESSDMAWRIVSRLPTHTPLAETLETVSNNSFSQDFVDSKESADDPDSKTEMTQIPDSQFQISRAVDWDGVFNFSSLPRCLYRLRAVEDFVSGMNCTQGPKGIRSLPGWLRSTESTQALSGSGTKNLSDVQSVLSPNHGPSEWCAGFVQSGGLAHLAVLSCRLNPFETAILEHGYNPQGLTFEIDCRMVVTRILHTFMKWCSDGLSEDRKVEPRWYLEAREALCSYSTVGGLLEMVRSTVSATSHKYDLDVPARPHGVMKGLIDLKRLLSLPRLAMKTAQLALLQRPTLVVSSLTHHHHRFLPCLNHLCVFVLLTFSALTGSFTR
jgi:hypothetical protein